MDASKSGRVAATKSAAAGPDLLDVEPTCQRGCTIGYPDQPMTAGIGTSDPVVQRTSTADLGSCCLRVLNTYVSTSATMKYALASIPGRSHPAGTST